MNNTIKTVLFWTMILLSTFLLWTVIKSKPTSSSAEISYADFLSQVEAGNVVKVTLSKTQAVGTRRDGTTFRASIPDSQEGMLQILHQKNVQIWITHSDDAFSANYIFNLIMPIAVLAGLWVFMIRRMKYVKQRPPDDSRPPNIG